MLCLFSALERGAWSPPIKSCSAFCRLKVYSSSRHSLHGVDSDGFWRLRSGFPAALHCGRVCRADGGWRPGHGLWSHLEHHAGRGSGGSARRRFAARASGRMLHHRHIGHQPPSARQYRQEAVLSPAGPRDRRRSAGRLRSIIDRRERDEAVRSDLPDSDRLLAARARPALSAAPEGSEIHCPARPCRRLPRCCRRWRLGTSGHVQPADSRRRSAQGGGHGQLGRILPDADRFDCLYLAPRHRRCCRRDARPADRRCRRRTDRRVGWCRKPIADAIGAPN